MNFNRVNLKPITASLLLLLALAPVCRADTAQTGTPNIVAVCPTTQLTSGLDVSDWQIATNWTQIKTSSHQFAFVKVLQGLGGDDLKFVSQWTAAKQAGLLRSAYAYFIPNADPDQQAKDFIAALQKYGVGELPPMLDWEEIDDATPAENVAAAQRWLDDVETWLREDQKLAWTPIIYTYAAYWLPLNAPATFARYPLFIADPNHACPWVPAPWKKWAFWQQKPGTVPGISDQVDIDFFSGTLDMLQSFATTPTPAVAAPVPTAEPTPTAPPKPVVAQPVTPPKPAPLPVPEPTPIALPNSAE